MSIRDNVSADELDRHLRAISAEVRLSGSPEEGRAFDYIEEQLKGFGYKVNRYQGEALIGYPISASLNVLGDEPLEIDANSYSLCPGTEPQGVAGELVYVGAGVPADYANLDVEGKIVLADGMGMPGKVRAASVAGAIGQIYIDEPSPLPTSSAPGRYSRDGQQGQYSGQYRHIHEMCISPVWGTPTPETASLLPNVPSVGVTREDGARLRQRLAADPVSVRLVTDVYRAWTAIPTLTADLPG